MSETTRSGKANKWKEIEAFPGYFINKSGEVRSTKQKKDMLLKPMFNHNKYHCVDLFRDGKKFRRFVHVLMADAFMGGKNGLEVDHIDGDKTNNSIENLRLVTREENLRSHWTVKEGASSRYRGVSWHKRKNKWCASIRIAGVLKHLGEFYGERAAALAFDCAARKNGFNKEGINFG